MLNETQNGFGMTCQRALSSNLPSTKMYSISSFLSNSCEIQWMPQSKQEKINGDFFEARKKTGLPVILWNSVAVDLS